MGVETLISLLALLATVVGGAFFWVTRITQTNSRDIKELAARFEEERVESARNYITATELERQLMPLLNTLDHMDQRLKDLNEYIRHVADSRGR